MITGGSRGLGLVMARQFVDRGARVCLLARDADELERARTQLVDRGATDVLVNEFDGGPDTVQRALATPDELQPHTELGLKDDEYAKIRDILGRRPTASELAMYSIMWSEHCSYKSSKVHLRQFNEKVPQNNRMLAGIGENAGVVQISDELAVTFKVESHNHPSFVEPYQGAATGVGGIVRDILAMGARPVAVMDPLRFGAADHPVTARVLPRVSCVRYCVPFGRDWFEYSATTLPAAS